MKKRTTRKHPAGAQPVLVLLALTALLMTAGACADDTGAAQPPNPLSSRVPPAPSAPGVEPGPDQPPVVWVSGTLTSVTAERVEVRGPTGSILDLRRVGVEGTAFFRASGGRWLRLASEAPVRAGQAACVETVMDGEDLLALRVFLGAGCGPS